MKIKFADSFWDSLDRMIAKEKWYWKTWDWIRYDFPKGVYNIFYFWRVVWNFRPWGHHGQLSLWERSMPRLRDELVKGNEIRLSANKKIEQMNKLIEIISRLNEDYYMKYAEEQLGYSVDISYGIFGNKDEAEPEEVKQRNRAIYDLSKKLEQQDWEDFYRILKGQDHSEYKKIHESLTDEEKRDHDHYYNWFDGTGIQGWWN